MVEYELPFEKKSGDGQDVDHATFPSVTGSWITSSVFFSM
jgi:hypothetical protein